MDVSKSHGREYDANHSSGIYAPSCPHPCNIVYDHPLYSFQDEFLSFKVQPEAPACSAS